MIPVFLKDLAECRGNPALRRIMVEPVPEQTEAEEIPTPHVGSFTVCACCWGEIMGPVSGIDARPVTIAEFSVFYDEKHVDLTVLYPGVAELLHSLRNTKKFGVVTNKPERFADQNC